MRLLHTSDWHLGRALAGERLIEDQAHALDQLIEAARDFRPDAVLISGDIYDRALPPPEAVALLDHVLSELILDLGLHVVLIPGNHDSRERLGFASRLLERNRLHIAGRREAFKWIELASGSGPCRILALPYLEPAEAREILGREDLADHEAALRAAIAQALSEARGGRIVVAAHAFLAGGQPSDSERALSVGGTGAVAADCFAGFCYAALGHLHRAQSVGEDRLQYSGALLKYSFAEADQQKSVNLVEIAPDGALRLQRYPLRTRRELRCLEGRFDDLMRAAAPGVGREDLVSITLRDDRPVLDAAARLRERYPNLLQLSQPGLFAPASHALRPVEGPATGHMELFEDFFRQVSGRPLGAEERAELEAALEQLRRQEQQA